MIMYIFVYFVDHDIYKRLRYIPYYCMHRQFYCIFCCNAVVTVSAFYWGHINGVWMEDECTIKYIVTTYM